MPNADRVFGCLAELEEALEELKQLVGAMEVLFRTLDREFDAYLSAAAKEASDVGGG